MSIWPADFEQKPDATALVYGDLSWTFAELNAQAEITAGRLLDVVKSSRISSMGHVPGDRVAVLMPTCPEYVFVIIALIRLGCEILPINLRLTDQEIRNQLEFEHCAAMICAAQTEDRAAGLADTVRAVLSVDGIESIKDINVNQDDRTRESHWSWPSLIAATIFTSGTTSSPKGVMLTYGNFLASAIASRERLGPEASARWLLCMPLYHVGGLSIIMRAYLYGSTVVLHDGFDVTAVNDAIDRDGITMVSLVPTMLHRLIEARAGKPFPETLKCILLGGAAASPKLIAECIEQNIPIALTYGLTEACSQVATATPEETRAKPGSVGRPLPGTTVRIIGDDGADLPPGEIGEIVVSGPTVMKGYLDNRKATGKALVDDWLHTGDLGYLDADGFLWPVQRRSDLIVTGGENVYPAEVEAVLETHPAVKEVCVVGIEDAEWGQRVAAVVVCDPPAPDAEALIAHCREKLAGYKCPRLIHFVEGLPRTASGKVQRPEARQMVEAWIAGARQAG